MNDTHLERISGVEKQVRDLEWRLNALALALGKKIEYGLYDFIPPLKPIVRDVCKECGK